MTSILTSNYRPLKSVISNKTFADRFDSLFSDSDTVDIASGYISEQSLVHLARLIEKNEISPNLNLIIGMHKFDGMTRAQKEATAYLKDVLHQKGKGSVYIQTAFPFHGKLYSFGRQDVYKAIVGSSNLSAITNEFRQFEVDFEIEGLEAQRIRTLVRSMIDKTTKEYMDELVPLNEMKNSFMDDLPDVEKSFDVLENLSQWEKTLTFELPLKCTEKSNLNVHNGEGRKQKNGFILPRDWFEIEIIVPKSITSGQGYPVREVFNVVTDDGYRFKCQTGGDYGKNFRSSGDLKTLGRWIKGRLQTSGALSMGATVTPADLEKYGRTTVSLSKLDQGDLWLLDFSVV